MPRPKRQLKAMRYDTPIWCEPVTLLSPGDSLTIGSTISVMYTQ